ncbi:hypothetical protein MATL_G00074260 [Megalops atlanticus]|uniref:SRCR domain-containing protein n=1 Tax=Megalops atlanticus TaxID=7932 RepID=A0A9D3T8D3_MEGAT|nr:hypothetical protein MATL_G00074260 [Megalops atlanticus]
MREAQVVCRQLGCGAAVSVEGNATFGRGNGTIWLDDLDCRGDELHLWDCCRSPLNQSDCSHKEDAGVNCTGESIPPRSPGETRLSTQPLSVPAVAFLVLGALSFLLLVGLVVLVSQNRMLKRAGSEGDHAPLHETVYEEIEYNLARGTYAAPQRRSVLSEDFPSGYEDIEGSEADALSGGSGKEQTGEDYDDVNMEESRGSLSGDLMMEDTPDNYDDVITVDQSSGSVAGELLKGDATEYYDDVIPVSECRPCL